MAYQSAFGHPRDIDGKSGSFKASLVPLEFLQSIKQAPIPITVSGTSNRSFNVAASTTNPVNLWIGDDFVQLKETLTHSMGTGSTNTVIGTDGTLDTGQTPGAAGVKYYYVGQDSVGAVTLHPSTAAPSFVAGRFGGGVWGHPGTIRDRHWRYVGWAAMLTTAPAFGDMVKIGYVYGITAAAITPAATEFTESAHSALIPAHPGVLAGGSATSAATGGALSFRTAVATDPGNACSAVGINLYMAGSVASFADVPVTSNGGIWAQTTAAGTVIHLSSITDVV